MTNDVDRIRREFDSAIAAAVAAASAAFEKLRAVADAAPEVAARALAGDGRLKLISIRKAAREAGISPQRMRALCRVHVYGADEGFGLKRGSRWMVVEDRFVAWLGAKARVSRV